MHDAIRSNQVLFLNLIVRVHIEEMFTRNDAVASCYSSSACEELWWLLMVFILFFLPDFASKKESQEQST